MMDTSKHTTITVIIDDQGGGGLLCNSCKHFEYRGHWPEECPNCHRKILDILYHIPPGGSDFE